MFVDSKDSPINIPTPSLRHPQFILTAVKKKGCASWLSLERDSKAILTGADDIAADVESRFEIVSALADLIAALHVPVAVCALGVESAALVQLFACEKGEQYYAISCTQKETIATQ